MRHMTIALNVYNTVVYTRSLKGEQIHLLSDSQRRLLGHLRREGLIG
jgi:hypothetical protein